ncbi:MAG: tetrahydromethanopterin S-methyltransferase subunit C [Methanobrevibacter sp.]|uniref:tetrahydromethanopterin S-methyltransferase subunit MtrC n=1 Tax=Methanobrevibacter sp. TaxID=66852 RepID=UPI0025EFD9B3|nr:tetrahydromethanopterin S-methyltransferase subunit C [Methanobrevibacter sp.]MBQ8018099.1 tetrahydromethanopterin S-methyltransferase subunit C [Methanobrevibacter sp.]MBQ9027067.1 tetrahydromethanopterin S-methyltransferase subunit C [Methanobrevibacter sp.]
MSAGGSADGAAAGAVSSTHLLILGIVGGLLAIYLTGFLGDAGSVIAGLGAVCAIVWGSDAIRRVASYGLGTGVPSIGYMSLSVGVISALAGISLATILNIAIIGPIAALVIAVIIGAIIALVATKIVGMKIPIMLQCTIEIAGAACLSILAFSVAIAGSYDMTAIYENVVATGFIAVLFILCTMAIQHPFNACLGPNEDQVRTLKCAASTAFLSMTLVGLLSVASGGFGWFIVFIVGLIGWIISFRAFVVASCNDAASTKWAGLWPKVEQ